MILMHMPQVFVITTKLAWNAIAAALGKGLQSHETYVFQHGLEFLGPLGPLD